jgi:hypothetical protein
VSVLFSYLNDRLEDGLPCYLRQAQKEGKSVRTIAKELKALTHIAVSKSSIDRWIREI